MVCTCLFARPQHKHVMYCKNQHQISLRFSNCLSMLFLKQVKEYMRMKHVCTLLCSRSVLNVAVHIILRLIAVNYFFSFKEMYFRQTKKQFFTMKKTIIKYRAFPDVQSKTFSENFRNVCAVFVQQSRLCNFQVREL